MSRPYFRLRPARGPADEIRRALENSWQAPKPALALRPLGAVYGQAAALRRLLLPRFRPPRRASIPVAALGNLTVGGSGKTPLSLALADLLGGAGYRPAILSRGYGRLRPAGPGGSVVVSKGRGPEVPPEVSGDEPWLMASRRPNLIVVVDADRARGASAAAALGADVAILDDGFQQLNLAVDCRLLLAPARNPFGNGAVLPAGPLREPVRFHSLADILISTGSSSPSPEIEALAAGRPLFSADYQPTGWRAPGPSAPLLPLSRLAGRKVAAFCGLARPEGFERSLVSLGLQLRRFTAFRDHQPYSPEILGELAAGFLDSGADCLVTTAKDAVKIPPDFPWPLFSLEAEMRPDRPEELLQAVLKFFGRL